MIAIALAGAIACGTLTPAVQREVLAVDPRLVRSVIANESAFDPRVTSPAGAQGLMQLMPATGRGLKVCDPYDPGQSFVAGTRHLKGLLDYYHGNVRLAVAAYNAGSGAVDKYGGVPPYAETQAYVQRVLRDAGVRAMQSHLATAPASKSPRKVVQPLPKPTPDFAFSTDAPLNK